MLLLETPEGEDVVDAVFAPGTRKIAYAAYDAATDEGSIVFGNDELQQGQGHLQDLVFAPTGNWLAAGWPEADQVLFLRLPGVSRIVTVADVRREFDPGATDRASFPRLTEWCCG